MTANIQNQTVNTAGLPGHCVSILHVEDSKADYLFIDEQLRGNIRFNYRVENANCLASAESKLANKDYDIMFLDLSLPDSSGIDTLQTIRQNHPNIPIIVLTGIHDDSIIDDVIHYGGQDYIHKDEFNSKLVARTIRYAIERKRSELELQDLAHHDPLTKLYNRSIFLDRLTHCLANAKRYANGRHCVVMLLDLDNFKTINDTLGHGVGDALLIQVANRIRYCVRESDTVARLGGDEFTILLEQIEQLNTINTAVNKIINALEEPFLIDGQSVYTSTSIGITSSNDEKDANAETILKNADVAMYTAKNKGGNQAQFFTRDLQVSVQIRNNLEKSLQKAIEEEEFELVFQPQINIIDNTIFGAETLLRWNHPKYGKIPPVSFIPSLEETGLIIPATEW
ncbi:MAG: GGDEF domain-containing response regulator, partial [Pseudomonadota bacterium]